MINYEKIKALTDKLELEIKNHNNKLFNIFPIQRYIDLIDNYPKYAGPKYYSDGVERYWKNIIKDSNTQTLEAYHKLLMVTLISRAENKLKIKKLPNEIKQYYFKDFNRIISQIENDTASSDFYLYPNFDFTKDLSICNLRMFPIGGRKYHFCRFPVRNFFNKGGRQFLKVLFFLIFEVGGRKPFLREHYDTHDPNFMAGFNLEGLIYSHRLVAEVMKLNPQIKGKLGTAWVGDPQIERVSPRLSYIRYFMVANGAKYFCLGSSDSVINNATMKSTSRRRLYNERKYVPSEYLGVWSRKSMIKWADKLKWHW